VSLLVNNAGVADRNHFVSQSKKKIDLMMSLNVVGTTIMTKAFLPPMVERGYGRVLFVSSAIGISGQPTQAVYSSTKAFVSTFCSSLRFELRDTGVRVSCLNPGATITSFAKESRITSSLIFTLPTLQSKADAVARAGVEAMLYGQSWAITGWFSHLVWFCGWLLPEDLVSWIAMIFWCDLGDAIDMVLMRKKRRVCMEKKN